MVKKQEIKENKAGLMLEMFPEFIFSLFFLLFGGVLHSSTCENSTEYKPGTSTAVAFFTCGFTYPDLSFVLLVCFFLNYRSNINHYQPSVSVNTQISASRNLLLKSKPDLTTNSAQFTSVVPLIWCQEHSSIMLIRIKLLFPCWLPLPSLVMWQDGI